MSFQVQQGLQNCWLIEEIYDQEKAAIISAQKRWLSHERRSQFRVVKIVEELVLELPAEQDDKRHAQTLRNVLRGDK